MGAVSSSPKDKVVLKSWSRQGKWNTSDKWVSSVQALLLISPSPVPRSGGPKVEAWQCPKWSAVLWSVKCILLEMVPILTVSTEVSGRKGPGMLHF